MAKVDDPSILRILTILAIFIYKTPFDRLLLCSHIGQREETGVCVRE